MLETFDFWIGSGKMEHLDELRDGELLHVHFEDVPANPPTEIQTAQDRVPRGEIMPCVASFTRSSRRSTPVHFPWRCFNPAIQSMDPYEAYARPGAPQSNRCSPDFVEELGHEVPVGWFPTSNFDGERASTFNDGFETFGFEIVARNRGGLIVGVGPDLDAVKFVRAGRGTG